MESQPKKDMSASQGTGNPPPKSGKGAAKDPEWANGLRQLYDSVVDEPLPDSFRDLLSKLDDDEG